MTSHQDKINQEQMETESGKIAWCIEWIQRSGNYDLYCEALYGENGLDLYDDLSICGSRDTFVWAISKPKGTRYLHKYVPLHLSWEQTKNVLDAQPWQYW